MKKIFTLLLAAGSISFASAQYTAKNDRNFKDANKSYPVNNGSYDRDKKGFNNPSDNHGNADYNFYVFSLKERDAEIERINRAYDFKILAVKRDRFLKSNKKEKQINLIEKQRNLEIKNVYARFSSKNNRGNSVYNSHKRF